VRDVAICKPINTKPHQQISQIVADDDVNVRNDVHSVLVVVLDDGAACVAAVQRHKHIHRVTTSCANCLLPASVAGWLRF
jgi:hypothetical protein